MKALLCMFLVAAALCAVDAGASIRTHVVYAQYFPIELRSLSENQALVLLASTLNDEVRMIAANRPAHEIIAVLLAACSSHTTMPTEVEGYEVPTHIFVFNDETASRLTDFRIAKPPPAPPPPNNSLVSNTQLPPPPARKALPKKAQRPQAQQGPSGERRFIPQQQSQEVPLEEEYEDEQAWFENVAQLPQRYDE